MGVELLGAAEAALLEHYLDTVEHLPDDVQRTISQLREIDQQYQHVLGELERMMCHSEPKKALIQKSLVRAQELADDKLHHMQQLMDTIDNKSRQLDFDARTLDKLNRHHSPATNFSECISKDRLLDRNQNSPAGHSSDDNSNQNIPNNSNNHNNSNNNSSSNNSSSNNNGTASVTHNNAHSINPATDRISQQIGKHKEENSQSSSGGNAGAKRARRNATTPKDYSESSYEKREKRGSSQQNAKGNKRGNSDGGQGKKRKSGRQQEVISPVEAIDPDEPTYCLCQQVSFGEMICCDNEECSIEWFHFTCVSLNTKPKGKWYCPRCRGDRSNQMKKVS